MPWRFELGVAIALGAILAIASNAHATALCENSPALGCLTPCAHPQPTLPFTFVGDESAMGYLTLNGKTSAVVCFAYAGVTSIGIVVYDHDHIFHGAFES